MARGGYLGYPLCGLYLDWFLYRSWHALECISFVFFFAVFAVFVVVVVVVVVVAVVVVVVVVVTKLASGRQFCSSDIAQATYHVLLLVQVGRLAG